MDLKELYKLSPDELYKYIKDNILYGFVGNDGKKYFPEDFENINIDDLYILQSPILLLESNCGDCWDVVELIRDYLNKNNLYNETYYIEYMDDDLDIHNTHTFIVYNNNGNWYNIEDNSSNNQKGVFRYDTKDEVVDAITNSFTSWIEESFNISIKDNKFIKNRYLQPPYGISSIEFQEWCKK